MTRTLAVLLLASNVFASCPSGWVEWEGHCAAIPQPEQEVVKEVQPSNEKPSRHPEPAWQRGDVIAATPKAFQTEAEEADAQIKWVKDHPKWTGSK